MKNVVCILLSYLFTFICWLRSCLFAFVCWLVRRWRLGKQKEEDLESGPAYGPAKDAESRLQWKSQSETVSVEVVETAPLLTPYTTTVLPRDGAEDQKLGPAESQPETPPAEFDGLDGVSEPTAVIAEDTTAEEQKPEDAVLQSDQLSKPLRNSDLVDGPSDSQAGEGVGKDGLPSSLQTGGGTLAEKEDGHDDEVEEDDADSSVPFDSWEGEYPKLNLNYDAIKHIATYYMPGNHGKCLKVSALTRGSYHEIELLEFEDGWSCLGRFERDKWPMALSENEFATMRYVKQHTNIPVPEIYFVDYNPHNVVGAVFCFMERLPGKDLVEIWNDLSLEQKKGVISQLADVTAQLCTLKFDKIGMLTETGLGPVLTRGWGEDCKGVRPAETLEEHMHDVVNISPANSCCKTCSECCMEAHEEIKKFFETPKAVHRLCEPPFVQEHGDFDWQNVLFRWEDKSAVPQLTGVIDWDSSGVYPMYYVLDYPGFLVDDEGCDWTFEENKILRQHFARELVYMYPEGSQHRQNVRDCFRIRNYFLQRFFCVFPGSLSLDGKAHDNAGNCRQKWFLRDHREDCPRPYHKRWDWKRDGDSDMESSEDDSEDEQESETDSDEGSDSDSSCQ